MTTLAPGPNPPGSDPAAAESPPRSLRSPAPTGPREPVLAPLGPASELALATVTMAAVAGFGRLFGDWGFLLPALAAALAAHTLAGVARRLQLGILASSLISGMGLLLFVTWVVEPHTTTAGLPGPATWSAVNADLSAAWRQFSTVVAPTATTTGFTLAAVLGAWSAAWMADLFAFRAKVRVEALIPSFTLFLFGAMLGADRHRVILATLYLASVLGFCLTADASEVAPGYNRFGPRGRRPGAGHGRGRTPGVVIALVAVAAGLVVGPRLPGAAADALVSWRDQDKASRSSRITVSPLVDIRGRLVQQSDAEAFTVSSPAPAYWRLTSLERFDGNIWSSRGSYQRARSNLPDGVSTGGSESTLRQDFTVTGLASIWLPAAFRPDRLEGSVEGLRYDRDTASLLTDSPTSDGLSYTVESSLPNLTEAELSAAGASVPAAIADEYLDLPAGFPPSVARQARQVVAGQTGPYGVARTLQDWFRDNFAYSLDVPAGHGSSAMEDFLARRSGYCEQFAGTFAAMARSLGLPSRVAVGFTAGTPDDQGRYRVVGRNAHAWPEVFIAGYGWVSFEPTPGRGQPGTEGYTGTAPVNDTGGPGATDDSTSPPAEAPATPPEGGGATETPPTTAPDTGTTDESTTGGGDPTTGRQGRNRSLAATATALLAAIALLALATAVAIPAAKAVVRSRRRTAATTPAAQVLARWREADEHLGALGLSRLPTETPTEHAARAAAVGRAQRFRPVGPQAEAASGALAGLAADATTATWSPSGVPEAAARRAEADAALVGAGVRAMAGRMARLRWALDPRPLLRSRNHPA